LNDYPKVQKNKQLTGIFIHLSAIECFYNGVECFVYIKLHDCD